MATKKIPGQTGNVSKANITPKDIKSGGSDAMKAIVDKRPRFNTPLPPHNVNFGQGKGDC